MKLKTWLAELRAPFFTASVIPVILGTAIAFQVTGKFQWLFFLAALFGGMLLHAGANVANDYFDYKNNSDNINTEFIRPFTGGSRMIQKGMMLPKEVLTESFVCFFLAALIGAWLIYHLGTTILWLGLIGAFSGFFYTAPPFKLVSRGIGEIFIGLNFGVLMTLGAYFVQTGELSWLPVIASIPVALLVTGILYINEFPDYNADKESGKLHMVARLGRGRAAKGYIALIIFVYLSIVISVILGIMPVWSLAVLITLPLAIKAVKTAGTYYDQPDKLSPANAATIQLHLSIGLILAITYIISAVV